RNVIQWDKDDCADLGLIKVDLLGLGMLAALEETIPLVKQHEGVDVDLAHLPPDDPEVYAMLAKADTIGVFQVESRAQMATRPRTTRSCSRSRPSRCMASPNRTPPASRCSPTPRRISRRTTRRRSPVRC